MKFVYSLDGATVAIRANGCTLAMSQTWRGVRRAIARERNGPRRCGGANRAGTINDRATAPKDAGEFHKAPTYDLSSAEGGAHRASASASAHTATAS